MRIKSYKWFPLLLLCVTSCNVYDPSLLDRGSDNDFTQERFDGGFVPRHFEEADSALGNEASLNDRKSGLEDVYTHLDAAGEDSDPRNDASLSDVTVSVENVTTDTEKEEAEEEKEEEDDNDSGTEIDGEIEPDATIKTDAEQDSGLPACRGARLFDLCWYLTDNNQSCQQLCTDHSGYDQRTADYLGSSAEGGNVENCSRVLKVLGYLVDVETGSRDPGEGYGCHFFEGAAWWLYSNDFVYNIYAPPIRIACACTQ